jgi:uncharacterized protein
MTDYLRWQSLPLQQAFAAYISALQAYFLVERAPAWPRTDYDRVGKLNKLFMKDTGMMSALLGWKTSQVADDADKAGKLFETFSYNELIAQVEAAEESDRLYQYRDREKREIDFLIEGEDHLLAIEIKSGLSVRKTDFKHIEWFQQNMAKSKVAIGIVLYAGEHVLPFGKNLWALPFACLWR